MKKSIIFLVVDSVYYKQLGATSYKHSATPFLDELKDKCVYTTNLYSQAPYTEAAVTPLLSGIDTLDYGGYMKRFAYRKTLPQVFHENGYETFINHYYSCVYPSKTFLDIDKLYYVNFYDFSQVYSYRFSYYRPLFLEDKLEHKEHALLYDIMEDNFKEWIHITNMIIAKDEKVSLLLKYGNTQGIEHDLEVLQKEYENYVLDSYAYMHDLFTQESKHTLFKLSARTLDHKVSEIKRREVQKEFRNIFERIYKINRNRNLRNLPIPIGKALRCLIKGNKTDFYQYLAMYKNAVFDADIYERIDGNYGNFKASICMRTYIEHAMQYIDQKQNDKPFCLYLHVDDAHSPENFFSSDSSDIEVLRQEFSYIQTYLNKLPKSYRGSLTSELSLLYVDNCIKYLFEQLNKRDLLKDSVVAITADHGFSYNYNPIRTTYVNNVYDENYNTPFYLYDESRKSEKLEGFYMAKDVLPTLLDGCDIRIPKEMTGTSMLDFGGRDYAFLEYMGGGCPDMLRRKILLGCKSRKYKVVISIPISDEFEKYDLNFVFNLQNDPLEQRNLAQAIAMNDIETEINILKDRFIQIQNNFKEQDHAFC